jgi:hypothetical protein
MISLTQNEKDKIMVDNGDFTDELFEKRKDYDLIVDEKLLLDAFDFHNERNYYGLVNLEGNTVLPMDIPENTKFIYESPARALDFVARAFENVILDYNRLRRNGVLVEGSFLSGIEPRKGRVDYDEIYAEHVNTILDSFFGTYMIEPEDEMRIKDFKTFSFEFLKFYKQYSRQFPLTKSKFMRSYVNFPLLSGLCVEIDSEEYGDYNINVKKFFDDPNFLYYQKVLLKHGFRIDKHIPWRAIADLTSVPMREYMEQYGIEVGESKEAIRDLFKKRYKRVMLDEIEDIKDYFFDYYSEWVDENPRIALKRFSKLCKVKNLDSYSSKTLIQNRALLSESDIQNKYDAKFWIQFYFKVRAMEEETHISDAKLNALKKRMDFLLNSADKKTLDIRSLLLYINSELGTQC